MGQEVRSKKKLKIESVAAILERELDHSIKEWTSQINLVPSLSDVRLSDVDRTCRLPTLFNDLLSRLRGTEDTKPPISMATSAHGRL
jgi:hypothetical protein